MQGKNLQTPAVPRCIKPFWLPELPWNLLGWWIKPNSHFCQLWLPVLQEGLVELPQLPQTPTQIQEFSLSATKSGCTLTVEPWFQVGFLLSNKPRGFYYVAWTLCLFLTQKQESGSVWNFVQRFLLTQLSKFLQAFLDIPTNVSRNGTFTLAGLCSRNELGVGTGAEWTHSEVSGAAGSKKRKLNPFVQQHWVHFGQIFGCILGASLLAEAAWSAWLPLKTLLHPNGTSQGKWLLVNKLWLSSIWNKNSLFYTCSTFLCHLAPGQGGWLQSWISAPTHAGALLIESLICLYLPIYPLGQKKKKKQELFLYLLWDPLISIVSIILPIIHWIITQAGVK